MTDLPRKHVVNFEYRDGKWILKNSDIESESVEIVGIGDRKRMMLYMSGMESPIVTVAASAVSWSSSDTAVPIVTFRDVVPGQYSSGFNVSIPIAKEYEFEMSNHGNGIFIKAVTAPENVQKSKTGTEPNSGDNSFLHIVILSICLIALLIFR